MTDKIFAGFIHGTGADQNVPLGWVPDFVLVANLTDGDKLNMNWLGSVAAFTSGGTTTLKAGDTIRGLTTTGATAKVRQVILDSGSWAAGDAAGWIIANKGDLVGSLTGENCEINDSGSNDITLSAAFDEDGIDDDTELAATTTDDTTLSSYAGSAASAAVGFKMGATISEDGKLLGVLALKTSTGQGDVDQTTVW